MKKTLNNIKIFFFVALSALFVQCNGKDDSSLYVPPVNPDLSHSNDLYLYNNNGQSLFEKYGTASRWRWNDNFIKPEQRATPIRADLVVPTAELIEYLWIGPYIGVGASGAAFIEELFPAELVFVGSYIYNNDGTILLGYAEGGARITLLNLNSYDLTDANWLINPEGGILATVHHEFTHIVHQNYGLPAGFNKISEKYLGSGWSNNVSLADAIKLGMVRNYGTANEYEDFCEIVSHFLTLPKADFEALFINQENCETTECLEINEGRKLIKDKLDLIISFYKNTFDIDLVEVRDIIETRLNNIVSTNQIP